MDELLKKILSELKRINKRLESIEDLLSENSEAEEETDEEINEYRTL